jgi:hypothetical protein
MGLDVSHGCWHGAYSAFMRWRISVARAAGIPLGLMEGFCKWTLDGGEDEIDHLDKLGWNETGVAIRDVVHATIGCTPILWSVLKPDPLHVLLNHSDCDGEIAASDCGPVADRLTELLPLLPEGDGGGHIGSWREKTQTFIDGLRKAAAAGEAVEFHG